MRIPKEIIGVLTTLALLGSGLSACTAATEGTTSLASQETSTTVSTTPEGYPGVEFGGLEDPRVLRYLEDSVYDQVLSQIDTDKYLVEHIEAKYVSQEYVDELQYNSRSNIYFGYTRAELNEVFAGQRYVFSVDESGKTVVTPFENYDDTTEKVIKNVAVGAGVIFFAVTISAVSGGVGAPAISLIFATGAKTGATAALADAAISGGTAAFVSAMEGKDTQQILRDAVLESSNGFKWGALGGIIGGASSQTAALRWATKGGLPFNDVARIQKDSKYPLDLIRAFHGMDEYEVFKSAGLQTRMVNGRTALVGQIDWAFKDKNGLSNLERARKGLAPLDPTGLSYELHHIGQTNDAPLAVLTFQDHRSSEIYKILHEKLKESPVEHGAEWLQQKKAFWKALATTAVAS